MEEEYVTIVEAARRIGMSDKTVRRAIHDGKLSAHYPQPNKAEVSITDLEAWHATLHVRPGETQDRLTMLESQMNELRSHVATLERQVADLQVTGAKKRIPPKPVEEAPTNFTYLSDFCALHFVPYQAAADLFPRAIHGQKIKVQGRLHPVIGPRGRHDFYVQLHTRDDFRACDDCPHEIIGDE